MLRRCLWKQVQVIRHIFIFLVLYCLVAVQSSYAETNTKQLKTLNRVSVKEVKTFLPTEFVSSDGIDPIFDLYEGLITFSSTGKPIQGVASNWVFNEETRCYSFTIDNDALWSDGKPLISNDFMTSFKRHIATGRQNSHFPKEYQGLVGARDYYDQKISIDAVGINIVNDKQIEFCLEDNNRRLDIIDFAKPDFFPLPSHSISENSPHVSNGAYKLEKTSQPYHFVKNEYHKDAKKTYFDRVIYHIKKDNWLRLFLSGEIDLTEVEYMANGSYTDYFKHGKIYIEQLPDVWLLSVGKRSKALLNKKIRLILNTSIQREMLSKRLANGVIKPNYTGIYSETDLFIKNAIKGREKYETHEKAKKLLALEGINQETPLNLNLIYFNTEQNARVAYAIKGELSHLNVIINTKALSLPEITKQHMDGDGNFDLALLYRSTDPEYLSSIYDISRSDSSWNPARWYNQQLEETLDTISGIKVKNSNPRLLEAATIFYEESFFIPLFSTPRVYIVNNDIQGFAISNTGRIPVHLTRWLTRKEHEPQ